MQYERYLLHSFHGCGRMPLQRQQGQYHFIFLLAGVIPHSSVGKGPN